MMRRIGFFRLSLVMVVTVGVFSLTSRAYAGFMLEFDYVSQGRGAVEESVQGGWAWGDAHFYLLNKAPDLNQLLNTHSVRVSVWTSKDGNVSKHLGSVIGDLKDTPDNIFTDSVSRINAAFETSTRQLYANVDFHDDAKTLQSIDQFVEGLFEKVTGQKGKGFLGWSITNAVKGIMKLAGVDIFGDMSWNAYIPENPYYNNTLTATSGVSTSAIPEPASMALLGLGGLLMLRRRH